MTNALLAAAETVGKDILKVLEGEAQDAEDFFVSAAKYAAANIKTAVVKATGDAVTAAESAFSSDTTVDKYAFAFSNAVAALEKDGIAFLESDLNYAIETVVQLRNARAAAPAPQAAASA